MLQRTITALTLMAGISMSASGDVIDFENAGDYGGDNAVITKSYFSQYGLQVTSTAGANAASASSAVLSFEAAGRDGTDAFWSSGSGRDEAYSGSLATT